MANTPDAMDPYAPTSSNDKGTELVEIVMQWYRGNRGIMNATQQTAVITAITGVLNGTLKV